MPRHLKFDPYFQFLKKAYRKVKIKFKINLYKEFRMHQYVVCTIMRINYHIICIMYIQTSAFLVSDKIFIVV